jgi:hypothetical protein
MIKAKQVARRKPLLLEECPQSLTKPGGANVEVTL